MKTKLGYLVLLFFLTQACSNQDELSNVVVNEEAAVSEFLSDGEKYEVSAEGGVVSIPSLNGSIQDVKCNGNWLTLKDKGLTRAGGLQFDVKPNVFASERTTEISVKTGNTEGKLIVVQAANIKAPDMSGVYSNACELAKKMYLGWNLGNTLEAIGHETWWGNPITTEAIIKGVKDAGFNAVRIPCSWNQYLENQVDYTIKASWLAHVKEIVDYCVKYDMYVMLNIHWDEGWLENNCTPDKKDAVNIKQKALWEQIAVYFRDYDEHLIFAGCNEPNVANAEQMAVLNSYEQTFVDAVRRSGGRNAYRNLIVQGPETNIDRTCELMIMPYDSADKRMMVEVHYYTPYNFCLMDEDLSWGKMEYFWGDGYDKYAVGEYQGRWSSWATQSYVSTEFAKMKSKFVDKGIPVILGEFAAARRELKDPVAQQAHDESRNHFHACVAQEAKNYGLVPFMWDTGGLLDRRNGMAVLDSYTYYGLLWGASAGKYPF